LSGDAASGAAYPVLPDFTRDFSTVCHWRPDEVASLPVPAAATLVKGCVEAAAIALVTTAGGRPAREEAAGTLRRLIDFPSLREVAIKSSCLTSLTVRVIGVVSKAGGGRRADAAASAILRLLREAGVDITRAGTLDGGTTPLSAAVLTPSLGLRRCWWTPART